jgi:hypothetical protein
MDVAHKASLLWGKYYDESYQSFFSADLAVPAEAFKPPCNPSINFIFRAG